ncbi:N-acetyltransferase family protein [Fodinisporobacter ferrooxydans]|uniref:N-acetyltransferase family protein n=1 Tax=Fodinisporobacter ferrooxydans TaxID=2901836 RepID=A0ABY4CNV3_9BACL|nr:N-acetyltransferase family protein [Alicyclobacillaceae bacterium MYW30-H2]
MFTNITFRDAGISDLPTIVDIYNATIPSRMVTADTEPVSVESREKWFSDHSPAFRPLWMIEYDGKACGWVSFQSFYGRPAYNATAEISIYIHQDFRGKKIGQYSIQKAIDACPRLRIKTLLAFIFGHNEPSLQLFARFGFEQWAHLPNIAELDGIERDLIILGKRIF